jgi:two-component system, chemotaxis family, chemotaxis protein CheY
MSKRLLIVDDSSVMRKAITKMVKDAGYAVAGEARSGAEAVEMYRELKPDVVTMDITMRDVDGIEATKRILSLDQDARIIFFSNLDGDKFIAEAKQIGAMGFVNKHKPPDLITLLKSVLEEAS